MTVVHLDSKLDDNARRERIYQGDLFVFSPTPASRELVAFACELTQAAFGSLDPEQAQYHMKVEDYAKILSDLKPRFIHHPECKRLLPRMLADLGCDLERTYFDVPRMRTATSEGYLTTGIAYAFHPHRDTWYSAPQCQINWWLPMYPISHDNCMAFHTQQWNSAVRNTSSEYNYQEWNRTSRFVAAQQIGVDTRKQPHSLEEIPTLQDMRLLPQPGGPILFSAAHLHSTVPNTSGRTRFSIDFRIVNSDDAAACRGAPNADAECTGSTMDDYLRGTDLSHLPADILAIYEHGHPPSQRVKKVQVA
jgi:hypothetical protein